ncbi:MAG: zinc-dependent alcohol dehydrogenase family protein [Acidobacteriota bacterium]
MQTKAAVLYEMGLDPPYSASRPIRVEQVELAGPGESEVLVELKAAALCHSDLSVIDGSRPRSLPIVLGHEASGIVREVGKGVSQFADGDHVVFSFVPICGKCTFCETERDALCIAGAASNLAGTLLSGESRFRLNDGSSCSHHLGVSGFSQFTVADQGSLVKIDPDLALERAALFGCAVMTGVGAVVNTAKVAPGSSVAVFGLGGVGLSAVMGARAAGAGTIVAVDVVTSKLELAREMGATHLVDARAGNEVEAVRDATGGGAETTIESVGSESVLMKAYAATARGGQTVTVGLPAPNKMFSVPAISLVAEERVVRGSYMGSSVPRRDIPRFIAMYREGKLPVDLLHTHTLRLDDMNEGFDRLAAAQAIRQIVSFD